MRRSGTRTWLAVCALLYAAGTACSTASPNLPPVEASGTPAGGCGVGNACQNVGSYCIGTGQACKYLECVGSSWRCPPDGGAFFDAGIDAADAAGSDATDARPESGNGDASGD